MNHHDHSDQIGQMTSDQILVRHRSVFRLQSSVTFAVLVLCTVATFCGYIVHNDKIRPLRALLKTEIPRWSRADAIFTDKYAINCPERCRRTNLDSNYSTSGNKDGDDRHVYLLIVVHSSMDHFKQRARIRRTWSNEAILTQRTWRRNLMTNRTQTKSTLRIETVFVTGQAAPLEEPEVNQQSSRPDEKVQSELEEEAKQNGDIIQGLFVDTYRNMTYKALTALQWIIDYCNNSTFILKTDDDAFVNIFAVVQHLLDIEYYQQYTPLSGSYVQQYHQHNSTMDQPPTSASRQITPSVSNPGVIMCRIFDDSPVHRHGKWHVSENEVPNATYPSYCSGIGYIMTPDVPRQLIRQAFALSSSHGPLFWIDDVYVTGMLVRSLNGSVRLFDMSKAYCNMAKMRVLYEHPTEWFKYVITHVSGLDDSGNQNAELFENTWNRLVRVATDGRTTPVIPRPNLIRPGRLADCYKKYYKKKKRVGVKARCIRLKDS